jgi:hypothetical protein
MVTIDILAKRHGDKDRSMPVVASTPEDVLVPLSAQGLVNELRFGEEHIERDYDHIICISSNFVRVLQTRDRNLQGAGYDHKNSKLVTKVERTDLGLARYNFAHVLVPPVKPLDVYIQRIMTERWNEVSDDAPVMSKYAAVFCDALLQGLWIADNAGLPYDARVLLKIDTHSPIIDAGAYALTSGKSLQATPFAMGEYFTGKFERVPLGTTRIAGEYFDFEIKGNQYRLNHGQMGAMRSTCSAGQQPSLL